MQTVVRVALKACYPCGLIGSRTALAAVAGAGQQVEGILTYQQLSDAMSLGCVRQTPQALAALASSARSTAAVRQFSHAGVFGGMARHGRVFGGSSHTTLAAAMRHLEGNLTHGAVSLGYVRQTLQAVASLALPAAAALDSARVCASFARGTAGRGLLTLVHFSAQLEPCLTQKHPTHPRHPLTPS